MQALILTAFFLFVTSSAAPVQEEKNLIDVEYNNDSDGEFFSILSIRSNFFSIGIWL